MITRRNQRHSFLVYFFFLWLRVVHSFSLNPNNHQNQNPSSNQQPKKINVAVVGGGISGLVIGHVLSASGSYNVTVLEANSQVGGHIRSLPDPQQSPNQQVLNIGHATHMGMFVNLRLMLDYLKIKEWPVGRGPNDTPGLFRMLSIDMASGHLVQPPLADILNPRIWWQAFCFYFDSFQTPQLKLSDYLKEHNKSYSTTFLTILYWAMATFEFDKRHDEMGTYCLGAARALLITQVFFQYLLCDAFDGQLPKQIDNGLKQDLAKRIPQGRGDDDTYNSSMLQELQDAFQNITAGAPLASYFTADYNAAAEKLADGIDRVLTGTSVTSVTIKKATADSASTILEIGTSDGQVYEADRVIFTTHPTITSQILDSNDFAQHRTLLHKMDTGAVGVKIIHASDLPFPYPPPREHHTKAYHIQTPPCILGIFDISQLTRKHESGSPSVASSMSPVTAGWLSVAHPIYSNSTLNRHDQWLNDMISPTTSSSILDSTIYPWTVATPNFAQARHQLEESLQGLIGIYMTGQVLTGVNKASELQVTNALHLCYHSFGVDPPWKYSYLYPMLPDCNDNDALYQAKSPLEAARLALKSLVGSFVLTAVVNKFGSNFFD